MSRAYYNENDAQKAEWLRELIKANVIAPGEVDERSITEIRAEDLRGFAQCHFFAGIGVWSYALRLAGWPDDRPVWTGSCPCPSFSCAGKGNGFDDPRHLWPAWFGLIRVGRPATLFGEQADDAIGYGWLDLVQTDLEGAAYSVGKAVLGACSVGAPHIRQRLYFCAHAMRDGAGHYARESLGTKTKAHERNRNLSGQRLRAGLESSTGAHSHAASPRRQGTREHGSGQSLLSARSEQCSDSSERSDTEYSERRPEQQEHSNAHGRDGFGWSSSTGHSSNSNGRFSSDRNLQRSGEQRLLTEDSGTSEHSDTDSGRFAMHGRSSGMSRHAELTGESEFGIGEQSKRMRLEGHSGHERNRNRPGWLDANTARSVAEAGATRGFWRDCDWWYGRDGKYRPIKCGVQPLVTRTSGSVRQISDSGVEEFENTPEARVLRLRGYGDSIVPQVAAEFIAAAKEVIGN